VVLWQVWLLVLEQPVWLLVMAGLMNQLGVWMD
jgi:hypothetical protein